MKRTECRGRAAVSALGHAALAVAVLSSVCGSVFAGENGSAPRAKTPEAGHPAPAAAGKPSLKGLVKPAFVNAPFVPAAKSARLQQLQALVDSKDWLKDPFRHLQTDMVEIVDDLADGQTHTPAHVSQPKIISRLDTLIELLGEAMQIGRRRRKSKLAAQTFGPGGRPRRHRRPQRAAQHPPQMGRADPQRARTHPAVADGGISRRL